MFEDYIGAIEAARLLGIHQESLKRLCRQGDVKAIKFRNTWLFKESEVLKFAKTYRPTRGRR